MTAHLPESEAQAQTEAKPVGRHDYAEMHFPLRIGETKMGLQPGVWRNGTVSSTDDRTA